MKYLLIALTAIGILIGCSGPKQTTSVEQRFLDTLTVTAPKTVVDDMDPDYELPRYNPSQDRELDIIHTKLDLRFNWEKEQVIGKAWITLTPYFYPTNELVLDAKGFTINSVRLDDDGPRVRYDYNGSQLTCYTEETYSREDTLLLYIDYIARPRGKELGGAISSDQGLFFINPRGEDPDKPMQIWTQGETEHNSRWFPTRDQPNERTTQEIILTVQDRFETLSNGQLISSKKNADGTRTDHWKMDLPHAPYLFMLAIGDYAVVKDQWRGKEVGYYVEHEYEPYARAIFSNTPEMLTYFTDLLGVDYPWSKYNQVVVRDYVSGAMENTGAVIYGEFVQKTDRELIDGHNERIIAHELFHQWFGDYVTCESWANLTMNEGFANYSEYLWYEHKYGREAADNAYRSDMNGYLNASRRGIHPLIHYGYGNKESMFDAHSYNKGGCVLHMLRNYVGDEAFFAGLKKYLLDNALSAVEADDLRLAFEDVTGKDLNWFFNQWFFEAGHPVLDIRYEYPAGETWVIIEQQQDPEQSLPIFQLPMKIDLYLADDLIDRREVFLRERIDTFVFSVPNKPLLVNVDADKVLLAEKEDHKSHQAYIYQYYHTPLFMDRWEAFNEVKNFPDKDSRQVVYDAVDDAFWLLRQQAIFNLDMDIVPKSVIKRLEYRATQDEEPKVRAAALRQLALTEDQSYARLIGEQLKKERSYRVIAAAIEALLELDKDKALDYAKNLEKEDNSRILLSVAEMYVMDAGHDHLAFYQQGIHKVSGFNAIRFLSLYGEYLKERGDAVLKKQLPSLVDIAMDPTVSKWKRFGATKSIHDLLLTYREEVDESSEGKVAGYMVSLLERQMEKIRNWETDSQLQSIYKQLKP